MNKKEKIAILIIGIILIGAVSYIIINPASDDKKININLEMFEVSHKNDDARTFTVELNEQGYQNEDGDEWNTYNQINPTYSFGIRLINVTIPKNATILDCYAELYSIGTPGHSHPNCKIYFDKVADAKRFNKTLGALNISGRIYTENYTIWNETVGYQEWVKTPSLKMQMQEIVNQKNWTKGNSVAVLFVTQKLRGYISTFQNYELGYASRLYVKWE